MRTFTARATSRHAVHSRFSLAQSGCRCQCQFVPTHRCTPCGADSEHRNERSGHCKGWVTVNQRAMTRASLLFSSRSVAHHVPKRFALPHHLWRAHADEGRCVTHTRLLLLTEAHPPGLIMLRTPADYMLLRAQSDTGQPARNAQPGAAEHPFYSPRQLLCDWARLKRPLCTPSHAASYVLHSASDKPKRPVLQVLKFLIQVNRIGRSSGH